MEKSQLKSCSNPKTIQQYMCRKYLTNSGYINVIHQADTSTKKHNHYIIKHINKCAPSTVVESRGLHPPPLLPLNHPLQNILSLFLDLLESSVEGPAQCPQAGDMGAVQLLICEDGTVESANPADTDS